MYEVVYDVVYEVVYEVTYDDAYDDAEVGTLSVSDASEPLSTVTAPIFV